MTLTRKDVFKYERVHVTSVPLSENGQKMTSYVCHIALSETGRTLKYHSRQNCMYSLLVRNWRVSSVTYYLHIIDLYSIVLLGQII